MSQRLTAVFAFLLLIAAPLARAQLSIEITGAGAQRIPIAIVAFAGEGALGQSVTQIVRADLERSGLFRGLEVPPLSPHPTETARVNHAEWLLTNRHTTVAEAAEQAGFRSIHYFSRLFHRRVGCPPSRYYESPRL